MIVGPREPIAILGGAIASSRALKLVTIGDQEGDRDRWLFFTVEFANGEYSKLLDYRRGAR